MSNETPNTERTESIAEGLEQVVAIESDERAEVASSKEGFALPVGPMTSLSQIVDQLEKKKSAGEKYPFVSMSARTLVSLFGHQRRTSGNVRDIDRKLEKSGLETRPHYNWFGIDDPIRIWFAEDLKQIDEERKRKADEDDSTQEADEEESTIEVPHAESASAFIDPVHRIGRFLKNKEIIYINRDCPIDKAMTVMLFHGFSRLPVMQNERNPLGMVSWQSIAQKKFINPEVQTVRECMVDCHVVSEDDSLFDAVKSISEHDVVLVCSHDKRITGILTATDVSCFFEEISQTFLLISYIENHLRAIIHANFYREDLQNAKDPADQDREVDSVADLTFGEYERLLDHPENWNKLGLPFEKKTFMDQIKSVRAIRNDVMHFNPEGIESDDLETLKKVNDLLMLLVPELSKKE